MSVKDALLAVINADKDGLKGRTLLQKKMYFVSVLVGEDFGFSPHFYGPYSSAIADQLGALCEAGLITEQSEMYADLVGPFGEVRRYDYRLTKDGSKVVGGRSPAMQPYAQAMSKVNARPIANDQRLLSIAAKVHFIVAEQGRATGGDIRRRAKELGWDISKDQLSQVVSYLESLDLVHKSSEQKPS